MSIPNFSEDTLTAEVLRRMEKTQDPRLKEVMNAFVKHMHAFVREVRPTQEEWSQGIQFLTETGHWCKDGRQEFILMSDTLGVSMLVDFINYGKVAGATESTVLGPFFVEGAPPMPLGANIVKPGTPGEPLAVTGTVKGTDGKALAGATLDVWETGGDGFYDVQKAEGTNLRAQFTADAEGKFHFKCVLPVSYPVPRFRCGVRREGIADCRLQEDRFRRVRRALRLRTEACGEEVTGVQPQTSRATSTIRSSFLHWSSCERLLPW